MITNIPSGLDEIINLFGDIGDSDFESNNIVSLKLPDDYELYYSGKRVRSIRCHKLVTDNFLKVFNDLTKARLQNEVRNYSGAYAKRSIRGYSSHPSTHSWGIAADFEAEKFPLGSTKRFPDEVVEIFQEAGFFYGGDFKSRKDPMHIQLAKNY